MLFLLKMVTTISDNLELDKEREKLRIQFFSSLPTGQAFLAVDEEFRTIEIRVKASRYRDLIEEPRYQPAARIEDIWRKITDFQPHIVHFSGHGSERDELLFQDPEGNPHPASGLKLSSLFKPLSNVVKVVVLNACYSDSQAREISEHIDCTIGISQTIKDADSRAFTSLFYEVIATGSSVLDSYNLAMSQIAGDKNSQIKIYAGPDIDLAKLRLLVHDSNAPDQMEEIEDESGSQILLEPVLSRETPICIVRNVSIQILDRQQNAIDIQWRLPNCHEELCEQAFWDPENKNWENLEKILHKLYIQVRDVHISLSLFLLDKNDEHKIHAASVLKASQRLFFSLQSTLEAQPEACQSIETIKTLLRLRYCAQLAFMTINRPDNLDSGIQLLERMCHWLLDAQIIVNKVIHHFKEEL